MPCLDVLGNGTTKGSLCATEVGVFRFDEPQVNLVEWPVPAWQVHLGASGRWAVGVTGGPGEVRLMLGELADGEVEFVDLPAASSLIALDLHRRGTRLAYVAQSLLGELEIRVHDLETRSEVAARATEALSSRFGVSWIEFVHSGLLLVQPAPDGTARLAQDPLYFDVSTGEVSPLVTDSGEGSLVSTHLDDGVVAFADGRGIGLYTRRSNHDGPFFDVVRGLAEANSPVEFLVSLREAQHLAVADEGGNVSLYYYSPSRRSLEVTLSYGAQPGRVRTLAATTDEHGLYVVADDGSVALLRLDEPGAGRSLHRNPFRLVVGDSFGWDALVFRHPTRPLLGVLESKRESDSAAFRVFDIVANDWTGPRVAHPNLGEASLYRESSSSLGKADRRGDAATALPLEGGGFLTPEQQTSLFSDTADVVPRSRVGLGIGWQFERPW
ncbi:MAG: hypothetical protein AAF211_21525, partial [Myxococcota bacterium]